jgi:hypothetical protein
MKLRRNGFNITNFTSNLLEMIIYFKKNFNNNFKKTIDCFIILRAFRRQTIDLLNFYAPSRL